MSKGTACESSRSLPCSSCLLPPQISPTSFPRLSHRKKTPHFSWSRWQESKNFLTQFSVGPRPQHIPLTLDSPPRRRRYFVFLFCTMLRACATPTSNNKQSSKTELGLCGCGLQHNVPKEGHLSAPADSLLIPRLCSLRSHTHLQLRSFTFT